MGARNLLKRSNVRAFSIENRAGPANAPTYETLARPLGLSWDGGDVTGVEVADPDNYGEFLTVDKIRGGRGNPTLSLEIRMARNLSRFLRLFQKGCALDLHLHSGACRNPADFNGGYEIAYVLENAEITAYNTEELGANQSDQNAVVNETIPLSGDYWYEIVPVSAAAIGGTQIVQEIVGVAICDRRQCGECGISSNGCEKIFGVTMSAGGSPGLPAEVIFSGDGGSTVEDTTITTLGATEDPTGIACVGVNVVVISLESLSHHYAPTADILDSAETWTEVTSGYVATHGPTAIFSLGSTFTWLVGALGYVYFSSDMTSGVTVQDAGSATAQTLSAIHGIDELNLIAVGASNSVIVTTDGENWVAVTGPAPGVVLNTVWMRSATEWMIGTAGGELWYTTNGGVSWVLKGFPGSGTGSVTALKFSRAGVGYMTHTTAAGVGRILRSIDGGFSWKVMPDGAGTMPDNDRLPALAVCADDVNFAIAGGLGANASDGIMIRVA